MLAFIALADPTRFRIVAILGAQGPLSAGTISNQFNVTASAISQHLRMLKQAQLVHVTVQAQKRIYSLDPKGLDAVAQWAEKMHHQWNAQIDALTNPLLQETTMTEPFAFSITRTFNVSRERLWRAWTEASQLPHWFGPKGCPVIASNLDFRVGGAFHYGMDVPGGSTMWGRWTFLTITPPSELTFTVSFSDETGKQITRNPWNAQWPLEMLSTVTLTEKNGKTELVLSGKAHNATEIEQKAFKTGADAMNQGWNGTLDQLEAYLNVKAPLQP